MRDHSTSWLCVSLCLLAVGCAGEQGRGPDAASGPNILLITVESLRTDHLGLYGARRRTSPSLDALAGQAVVFENAYATTSWTLPSHASIFTGLYPSTHRVTTYSSKLAEDHTTLAEVLQDAGYRTAGFVSGPLLQPKYNLDQGFEIYDPSAARHSGEQAHSDVTNPEMERLINDFLDAVDRDGRPFFMFAYLWDPHYDYIPPPPYDQTFVLPDDEWIDLTAYRTSASAVTENISPAQLSYVVSQYDGEILWTDEMLGRLWKRLQDLGLWNETAVIVTSDHGEAFFEHGTKGHGQNLFEEVVHVPLIIKLPGRERPLRDARFTSLVDLYPTMAELAGVRAPEQVHGRSLLKAESEQVRPIFLEFESDTYPTIYAIRIGDRKLHVEKDKGLVWLFDLAEDPGEQSALPESESGDAGALLERLAEHLNGTARDAARWEAGGHVELSAEELERLRALGYLGN